MMTFNIGVEADQSIDTIERAATNIPIGASLGRILVVSVHGILTEDDAGETALWGIDDDGYTWRLAGVNDELAERTTWAGGVELTRHLLRREP